MAKLGSAVRKRISKKTSQGGSNPKTASFSKNQKRSVKVYRGQGR